MTENQCEFCENKITAHYPFTYICDNCRGIIERLKKQIEELAEGSYLKTELQKILGEEK
jgi:hypothetical protein